VSWTDVVEPSSPPRNAVAPGLDAALPSEAQWEYACRAATGTPFWFGENLTPEQVNYNGNFSYAGGAKGEHRERTADVKALPANAWGLYQIHGNVWEWCADWLGAYSREPVVDPEGPVGIRGRVLRGGSWFNDGRFCRSAFRLGRVPGFRRVGIGFPLARGSSSPQVERQALESTYAAQRSVLVYFGFIKVRLSTHV